MDKLGLCKFYSTMVLKLIGKTRCLVNVLLLHLASVAGRTEVVTLLLDRGADIDLQDNVKMSSLHYTSLTGCPKIAELMFSDVSNDKICSSLVSSSACKGTY